MENSIILHLSQKYQDKFVIFSSEIQNTFFPDETLQAKTAQQQ